MPDPTAMLRAAFEAGMQALSEAETDDRGFFDAEAWKRIVDERFDEWYREHSIATYVDIIENERHGFECRELEEPG